MLMDDVLIQKIDEAIAADQGDSFRASLRRVLPKIADIYRQEYGERASKKEMPKMRISGIGSNCTRKMWYNYRMAKREKFDGRIIRLFNRGHMEEARIIAMLETVGAEVIFQDGENKDLSFKSGDFAGTCDGKATKVPGYEESTVMLEYKTMNKNQYSKYMKEGLALFSDQYHVQVHFYLTAMKLDLCLFIAVCKDDDKFNIEVIRRQPEIVEQYYERALKVMSSSVPPERLNDSPLWWECKWCGFHSICHGDDIMNKNCRTCKFAERKENGDWHCQHRDNSWDYLSEEQQYEGCQHHLEIRTESLNFV